MLIFEGCQISDSSSLKINPRMNDARQYNTGRSEGNVPRGERHLCNAVMEHAKRYHLQRNARLPLPTGDVHKLCLVADFRGTLERVAQLG